jgi:hypothetical protein
MAHLSHGNTIKKRISSIWPHVIGDQLTYEHNFVQVQGNSTTDDFGFVEQNPSRTLPGFGELPGLFMAIKGYNNLFIQNLIHAHVFVTFQYFS